MTLGEQTNYLHDMSCLLTSTQKKWLAIVAILGALSNTMGIFSLQYINLVYGSLLNNLFPVFVLIVAAILIKEYLKWS